MSASLVYVQYMHQYRQRYVVQNYRDVSSTETSSSAVAERPPDALCPSVVSLNKITRADSFIIVT